jgi:hypothetical protein
MNDKLSFGKVFVLGFALFAMFFGAGNLIFPPALGIVTGTNWIISFLVYILADAALAILALLAFFRCQEGFQNSISIQLDKTTSFLLILFNTLCIGPFIAIPRTAATTFDIAVKPLLGASFPGWSSWVAGGIYFGLVLILCLRPGKVVDIIGKVLSPTMFVALLEHPDFEKTDFSYVRTGIMAGSPCPISKMQDVVNKMNMKEIVIVYGQTEASPGCTMSSTDDPLEVRVGTVGSALPEIECKVIDPETGEEMPVGQNGEFVARGYNIMKGYYKMPRATASAIDKDGWLHTGDLAAMTEDGNFRITGRLKDMIIRGGENIYPKEIEEFIYTHPKVKDVQVIGVPDEQYGEEIMACIILKEGESMTEKEMKGYILDHMARHKVPKYIDFVDAFPMNAAGKILKYKMREDAVKKLGLQKAAGIVTA